MSQRKIAVAGKTYHYSVGKTYTRFDFGAVANWELAGMNSPNTFERGQYKRTSDGMVTPKMVADYLKARGGDSLKGRAE